ncbi:hypothetical protein H5410_058725, partial [Solanum commersonii]
MVVILRSCDLVELWKVVGSIARQSIGESSTHLTLKTFHISGVFTGHLYITIESKSIIYNVNIPSKILLLVQNDQYVESEQ